MARLTSNPHCNCNASFRTDGTLLDRCVRLSQVHPSSEHGSVRAVFLFLGALQMQQAGVTLVSQVLQVEEPDQGDPCTAEDAIASYKATPTPVYHSCSFVPPPGKGKFHMSANSSLCLCQLLTLQLLASAPRHKNAFSVLSVKFNEVILKCH